MPITATMISTMGATKSTRMPSPRLFQGEPASVSRADRMVAGASHTSRSETMNVPRNHCNACTILPTARVSPEDFASINQNIESVGCSGS